MLHVQYIKVPFNAAFPLGNYLDNISLTLGVSGDYFLASYVSDNFDIYPTGTVIGVSGSGFNAGFWTSSGVFLPKTCFVYNELNIPTGFYSGIFLSGSLLNSGYLTNLSSNPNGSSFSVVNFIFEGFQNYNTGFNTGYFDNASGTNRNYQVLQRSFNSGFTSSLVNFFAENFENYITGTYYNYINQSGEFNSGIYTVKYNQITGEFTGYTKQDFQVLLNFGTDPNYFRNSGGLVYGIFDYGISTDTPPAYTVYPDTGNFVFQDFTIEGWFYPLQEWGTNEMCLIDKNFSDGFFLGSDAGSNEIHFYLNGTLFAFGCTIPTGQWSYLALSRINDTLTAYTGGLPQQVFGSVDTTPINNGQPFILGNAAYNGFADTFTGYMTEIRIWTSGRSDDEILNNFNQKIDRYQNQLSIYLTF